MGARGGCWGGWHGEHSISLPLPSPFPDGDAETTHRNLLPRSCGDADLAGPPDQEKVVGPQPRVQGSNTNQTPALELFIFILKEKKNKKTKKPVQNPIFQCQPCPPPTPRSVPLAQSWTLSSRSAPSPFSCNPLGAGGSNSLGC